jgi:hypothetical protein
VEEAEELNRCIVNYKAFVKMISYSAQFRRDLFEDEVLRVHSVPSEMVTHVDVLYAIVLVLGFGATNVSDGVLGRKIIGGQHCGLPRV